MDMKTENREISEMFIPSVATQWYCLGLGGQVSCGEEESTKTNRTYPLQQTPIFGDRG
jgi:hypothetical protein